LVKASPDAVEGPVAFVSVEFELVLNIDGDVNIFGDMKLRKSSYGKKVFCHDGGEEAVPDWVNVVGRGH
jgi:hypothetical protein